MMKDTFATRLRNINLPLLAGLLLLASCSQDGEPAGEPLPDGQYPLEIASVTLGVEGTEQPWTRITETADGSGRDDQLTARGGNGGAGIGGYYNKVSCGNITIRNVTVYSYGSLRGDMAAGIGSTGDASCGAITIDNATVHAYGTGEGHQATPAIGSGFPSAMTPTSIPKVTITGQSEVHAHRGGSVGNTDYIGWGGILGNYTAAANAVNLGGGTCTNSTVYCYTGTGNTPDKTLDYDASGTGTERP